MAGRWGLADILRSAGEDYGRTHALSGAQAKAWRAIVACRTEALGGSLERCNGCGKWRQVFHSCRNRHCPQCQTRAKEAWLAKRRREVLPVPYFHLVFTLPHALNGIAARHARAVYEMLFGAAAATLTEFAANPRWLGGRAAFSLVLHTWKQDLNRHLHVHALMAGGALTEKGEWARPRRGFLFPVKALSKVFRGKFIAALAAERDSGRLRADPQLVGTAWPELTAQLTRHDWVVYAKQPLGGAEQVLEYLGRYTHRVAISNERIVGVDAGQVRLRVRDHASPGGKRVIELPAPAFIERYLQHVLPSGFKRIRHYGLLGPARKTASLAAARAALGAPMPDAVTIESVEAFMRRVARIEWTRCPHCAGGHFLVIEAIPPNHCSAAPRGPPGKAS